MKRARKVLLPTALGLLLLLSGCSIGGCGSTAPKEQAPASTYGVVRMEEAVKANPGYAKYKQLENEYDNLKALYDLEQRELGEKAKARDELVKAAATDASILGALDAEYRTKVAIKEKEINGTLNKAFSEYVYRFQQEVQYKPTEAELRIVNLQLELKSLLLAPEVRTQKEEELQKLLAARATGLRDLDEALVARVQKEMEPIKEKAEKDMKAYADELMKELIKKRDEQIKNKISSIKGDLPNPIEWNQAWKKRLEQKQAEVKAAHDSILEDIRARVASVASTKGLELVVAEYKQNRTAVDITDEIISTYGK